MTKEELQKRIAAIEQSLQQLLANYNMLQGGLEENKQWLKQLEEAPVEC